VLYDGIKRLISQAAAADHSYVDEDGGGPVATSPTRKRSIDDPSPVLYRRKHVAGAGTKLVRIGG
jgi:hypothetical protein